MDNLVDLYCAVDDFCRIVLPELNKLSLPDTCGRKKRDFKLSTEEIMTIIIHFHQSHYRDFKTYYTRHVRIYLSKEFPHLVVIIAL